MDAIQILGLFALISMVGAIVVRFGYSNFAPSFSTKINIDFSSDNIQQRIETIFPESDVTGRPWKRNNISPESLELSAYPLPYWGGCLIMLATGIIWGFVAWVIMGRQDKVSIIIAEGDETTIQIDARGYAAVSKANEFLVNLKNTPAETNIHKVTSQEESSLGVKNADKQVEELRTRLKNDGNLILEVVESLTEVDSPEANQFLSELAVTHAIVATTTTMEEDVRSGALIVLKNLENHAVKHLLITAQNPTPDQQSSFVEQSAAVKALGLLKANQVVSDIIGILENPEISEWVRSASAEALGEIGNSSAIEPLIAILEDENVEEEIREASAEALGKLGDKRANDALLKVLKYRGDDDWRNYTDWGLHSKAAKAIGNLGDERAFEPLVELLNEDVFEWQFFANIFEALPKVNKDRSVEVIKASLSRDILAKDVAERVLAEITSS